MDAVINRLSWIDRGGDDLPPGIMEVTLSIRVRKGSPEFNEILRAAKEKTPSMSIEVNVNIGSL